MAYVHAQDGADEQCFMFMTGSAKQIHSNMTLRSRIKQH